MSLGASVSGTPLQDFRRDIPPGWAPNLPDSPLKRLRAWYQLLEGPVEAVGSLIAERLQGRTQQIALQLRLPDPQAAEPWCGRQWMK